MIESVVMSIYSILEATPIYRLWQAPFRQAKIVPLLHENDLSEVRLVSDVGCGPGTNANLFRHLERSPR